MTVAASLVAQAKSRAEATPSDVATFVPRSTSQEDDSESSTIRSRIDETPDPETGTPRLRVIIPGANPPEIYDFARFLTQPDLARFIIEGFRQWAGSVSTSTRSRKCRELNSGLGAFLSSAKEEIQPASIDKEFWTSFVAWLNGPRHRNGKVWHPTVRAKTLNAVKICITALFDHPEHGEVAAALMDKTGFPRNAWPGRSRKNVPTEVLSPPERHSIILASLNEFAAIRQHIDEREAKLETGRALLENARQNELAPLYRTEIGACAAMMTEAFPNKLAKPSDLSDLDPDLINAIQYKHGMVAVRRILYATFRDLVPFVLLIAMKTAFNSDTILSLKWSQIKFSEDGRTITFLGVKNRSSSLQASITDDDARLDSDFPAEPGEPFALADLLDTLRQLTERTRQILSDPSQADRLFVGIPAWGSYKVKSYEHKEGPSSDTAWKFSLQKFIQDHQLKHFSLKTLRFTEGEAEWRRTGDLLAVRDRLGHQNMATTRTHYTSDGMRRESQLRVAETQVLYQRWARTDGRVDPRCQPEECRSAATPGFGCLNPFDSPRPGQRKGKLCTAYGECPVCPHAQAWPQNVQAVAYYLALPTAIQDARLGRISPSHWAKKWPPILAAHTLLLEEIPAEVRAEATRFHVKLMPVG